MFIIVWVGMALTFDLVFGSSTSGKHFVASCPWLEENALCTAYIATLERVAKVTITELKANIILQTQYYYVWWNSPVKHQLNDDDDDDERHTCTKPLTRFSVNVFKSQEQFRVTVITRTDQQAFEKYDAIILTPKISCFNSYYTITSRAFPFFVIFSFEYVDTNVNVKFPHLTSRHAVGENFYLYCSASEHCEPGKTVSIDLSEYDAWYFTVQSHWSRLLNVLITSNNPVYVISGNRRGVEAGRPDSVFYGLITSLKPSTTWGTEYVVPSMTDTSRYFAMSTENASLVIKFHEKVEYKIATKTLKVLSPKLTFYYYGKTENMLLVTADLPFGLYEISSLSAQGDRDTVDISILNVIPVEQWTPGMFYYDYDFPHFFRVKCYLITQTKRREVVFPFVVENTKSFRWHSSSITSRKNTYSVSEFVLEKQNSRFYVNIVTGRIILYISLIPIPFLTVCFAKYPNDLFQREVYKNSCRPSKEVCSRDGIDNDCDGFIDEEEFNEIDDDGDGRVDEDYTELVSDGHWSSWQFVCFEFCNDTRLEVKVRSCLNRSPYGKFCVGEDIQCDGKICPDNCFYDISNDCFCNSACDSCERSIFKCDSCQEGYSPIDNCLTAYSDMRSKEECIVFKLDKEWIKLWHVIIASLLFLIAFIIGVTVWSDRKLSKEENGENELREEELDLEEREEEEEEEEEDVPIEFTDENIDIDYADLAGQIVEPEVDCFKEEGWATYILK